MNKTTQAWLLIGVALLPGLAQMAAAGGKPAKSFPIKALAEKKPEAEALPTLAEERQGTDQWKAWTFMDELNAQKTVWCNDCYNHNLKGIPMFVLKPTRLEEEQGGHWYNSLGIRTTDKVQHFDSELSGYAGAWKNGRFTVFRKDTGKGAGPALAARPMLDAKFDALVVKSPKSVEKLSPSPWTGLGKIPERWEPGSDSGKASSGKERADYWLLPMERMMLETGQVSSPHYASAVKNAEKDREAAVKQDIANLVGNLRKKAEDERTAQNPEDGFSPFEASYLNSLSGARGDEFRREAGSIKDIKQFVAKWRKVTRAELADYVKKSDVNRAELALKNGKKAVKQQLIAAAKAEKEAAKGKAGSRKKGSGKKTGAGKGLEQAEDLAAAGKNAGDGFDGKNLPPSGDPVQGKESAPKPDDSNLSIKPQGKLVSREVPSPDKLATGDVAGEAKKEEKKGGASAGTLAAAGVAGGLFGGIMAGLIAAVAGAGLWSFAAAGIGLVVFAVAAIVIAAVKSGD